MQTINLLIIWKTGERNDKRRRRERQERKKTTHKETETMEQISIIEKHIINNRKERVKETRESGKRRRAAVNKQGETEEEITCTKRIKPNHTITNKPGTPNHINHKAILGANGSPESKWDHGFLLSGSLSEHFTASSSNFDEDTLSECSRFRMPLPLN